MIPTRLTKFLLILGVLIIGSVIISGIAGASTTSSVTHVCTESNPEYLLVTTDNAPVSRHSDSASFSATNKHDYPWENAYDVTGAADGYNSDNRCGHLVYDNSYDLPFPFDASGTYVTGGMSVNRVNGRAGWDIWLTPTSYARQDMSATQLEDNRNTLEVMVDTDTQTVSPTRWKRSYVRVGSLGSVNLKSEVQRAANQAHVNLGGYSWVAIDGGAEFNSGTFDLYSYTLLAKVEYGVTEGYGVNREESASGEGMTEYAWHYTYARKSHTATVDIKGRPYSTAHADAVTEARDVAGTEAKDTAIIDADAAAKKSAETALAKVEPYKWTPYVIGANVTSADATLRAYHFSRVIHENNLRNKRGYRVVVSGQTRNYMHDTSPVYIWERYVR